jgi:hypothetical protein
MEGQTQSSKARVQKISLAEDLGESSRLDVAVVV